MPTCVANEHGHVCCVETQGPFNMVVFIPIPITTKWVVHINTSVQYWARVSISISEPHVLFLSVLVPLIYSMTLEYSVLTSNV